MTPGSVEIDRRLKWLCILLWVLVGLPVVLRPGEDATRLVVWGLGFLLFGVAMALGLTPERSRTAGRVAPLVQLASVLAMVLTLCDGLEGFLLAIIALQLAVLRRPRVAQTWIVAQSLLLGVAIWQHWSLRPALLLTPAYFGVQLLTYWCAHILFRETELRKELEGTVVALTATRELLTERARTTERRDLTDELHDVVGHRLVALRLNLEVLARSVSAPALESARSIVRQVHDDVQDIVDLRKDSRELDFHRIVGTLAKSIPHPQVHIDTEQLDTMDPARGEILFRCCLELVTNAVKHAQADNVWIVIRREDGQLRLTARDDGRGARDFREGRGLDGMRRRLLEMGGTLEIHTSPGAGFRLSAILPVTVRAA